MKSIGLIIIRSPTPADILVVFIPIIPTRISAGVGGYPFYFYYYSVFQIYTIKHNGLIK